MKTGIELIAAERERQIAKGYTPEHDDEHDMGELGLAAALDALPYDAELNGEKVMKQDDYIGLHILLETGFDFFIEPEPDRVLRLTRAGALIAAEIDRLNRTQA